MTEEVMRLPLFPLNTTLFPGQMLPLHIFEPRYRLMIDECMKEDIPFGVVLIREGREVGGLAVPHRVGTTARIVKTERLEDGRMNIATVGETRFRILQLHHDKPYLTSDSVAWPWAIDRATRLLLPTGQVRRHLEEYLAALTRSLGDLIDIQNMPTNPVTLACLVAIALQVPTQEKQDLLVSPTIVSLLDKEVTLLQRETHLLRITGGIPTRLMKKGERILSDD